MSRAKSLEEASILLYLQYHQFRITMMLLFDSTDDFTLYSLIIAQQKLNLQLMALSNKRYFADRRGLMVPRHTSTLEDVIAEARTRYSETPRYWRRMMRVTPAAFDVLVHVLDQNPIFQNLPNHAYSTSFHLAVFLWRFGRTGELTGDIVFICGVSEGTIQNMTDRVAQALVDIEPQVLCPASDAEKQDAKNLSLKRLECRSGETDSVWQMGLH